MIIFKRAWIFDFLGSLGGLVLFRVGAVVLALLLDMQWGDLLNGIT